MSEDNRYIRQQILPEIGLSGQDKLSNAKVVVIGAGGLGCPVLSYLVGAGIGNITIVDPDVVEVTNLHRQPLYTMADIGNSKAQSAAKALAKYNPQVSITTHVARIDPSNVDNYCSDADVVIDAADSFAVTYTLSDYCFENKKALISASVLGFKGYVAGFCGALKDGQPPQAPQAPQAPSIRAVFPNLPASAQNCSTAGVSGPAVGVLGSLQAQLAMNTILELDPSPLGRMLNLDLHQLTTSTFSFLDAPEPVTNFSFISLNDISDQDSIIDLRSIEETAKMITPTAIRVDISNIENLINRPAEQRIVLCCKSGLRAWNAGLTLQSQGHKNIALIAVG